MTQPRALNQVIGNAVAIDRIRSEIAENGGLAGCVFFLQGKTGNGKTMLADIIADMADGDVFRPNCNDNEGVEKMMERIETFSKTPNMFGGLSVFIFDECDRLSVENISNFKIAFDVIHREKMAGKKPPVVVIFTTAQSKESVNPSFRKHWDEFASRCVYCEIGITKEELNEHFAKVSGGAVVDISERITVHSVREAWKYLTGHGIQALDVAPEAEAFVLPENQQRKIGDLKTNACTCRCGHATVKPQQNLVGIIRGIVSAAGAPVSYATIRAEIDRTEAYQFKRGCEGWRRTNQITSAVHNHIKKYGDAAVLTKTADGKVTTKN